uniref:CSab-Iso-1 n=1 Tax=Isometroides vescus TaxID=1330405 RepID=T1E7N5_9SCOR
MNFVILFTFLLFVIGVQSKKNGFALSGNGKATECNLVNYLGDYCDNECKYRKARKGYCCTGKCYCFDLPDNAKTFDDVYDITKSYCNKSFTETVGK